MRKGYVDIVDKNGTIWIINQDRIYFIELPPETPTIFTVHGFGRSIVLEFNEADAANKALKALLQ